MFFCPIACNDAGELSGKFICGFSVLRQLPQQGRQPSFEFGRQRSECLCYRAAWWHSLESFTEKVESTFIVNNAEKNDRDDFIPPFWDDMKFPGREGR